MFDDKTIRYSLLKKAKQYWSYGAIHIDNSWLIINESYETPHANL